MKKYIYIRGIFCLFARGSVVFLLFYLVHFFSLLLLSFFGAYFSCRYVRTDIVVVEHTYDLSSR